MEGELARVRYLGGASRVVDRAGDEDAAAAVDDEGAVVVRDGRIGRGRQEGGRQEDDEQDATTATAPAAAGDRKTRRCGHGARRPPRRSSPPESKAPSLAGLSRSWSSSGHWAVTCRFFLGRVRVEWRWDGWEGREVASFFI